MKNNANFPCFDGPQSLRGLSLIELMISITIGLLILASMSSMFVQQSRARAELDKSNRMIDNGRYALEMLSSNLMMAGFFDQFVPVVAPVAWPDPCATATMLNPVTNTDLLSMPVQGYDAATAAVAATAPPCGIGAMLKSGSDILVIRRASSTVMAQNAAPTDGTLYLQVTGCVHDAIPYLLFNNPAAMTLAQNNIAGVNNCMKIGNNPVVTTAPFANLRPFVVEAYFVAPDNNPGDGIPTLKRMELTAAGFVTTPLVEGIEYLQVEYGVDDPLQNTDNYTPVNGLPAGLDGVPDYYTTGITCNPGGVAAPCTLADWSNVVAVKLHLVSRNIEETRLYKDTATYSLGLAGTVGPFNDTYKRHAYTQLVRLINPSGRREPP